MMLVMSIKSDYGSIDITSVRYGVQHSAVYNYQYAEQEAKQ